MQKYYGTNKSCWGINAELIDEDDTGRVTPISETNLYFKTMIMLDDIWGHLA